MSVHECTNDMVVYFKIHCVLHVMFFGRMSARGSKRAIEGQISLAKATCLFLSWCVMQ